MPLLDINNIELVTKYKKYINESIYSSITQTLEWSQVKQNWIPKYIYLIDENNNIKAAISILMVKQKDNKMFAYASKGPVMDMNNIELFNELMIEVKTVLKNDNVCVVKVDPEVEYTDEMNNKLNELGYITRNRNLSGQMHDTIQPRFNMVLNLNKENAETIYDYVPSKTKNKLRKPFKEGITVDYGLDEDYINDFYKTYEIMSQRHDITYRPKEYFERMETAFRNTDKMRVYRATFDNELLGTGICFKTKNKVWYMYAGTVNDSVIKGAAYAIQVEMIQWAIDNKVEYYDLGGIEKESLEDSLWQFKHNFVRDKAKEYIGEIDMVIDENSYNNN